jgi:hypothetical protein
VERHEAQAKSCLCWVPDDPEPFDALTVHEHLEFTAALYSVPDWRERAEQLLERFELTEKRDALGGELSAACARNSPSAARGCRGRDCADWTSRCRPGSARHPLAKQAILEARLRRHRRDPVVAPLALIEELATRLLILDRGLKIFEGTLGEARTRIPTSAGSSLEAIFWPPRRSRTPPFRRRIRAAAGRDPASRRRRLVRSRRRRRTEVILGHPALRLLARRKLVGIWRRQKRRLKRPSGIAFALLGLLAIGYWIAVAIVLPLVTAQRVPRQPLGVPELCVVGFGLTVFTLIGSLNFRGLYLPKEEIDRLFSAPVSRSDLVRYRLITSLGRSLFGALFFGAVLSMRLPHPMYGFLGAVVSMLTLPLLGQAASLLLGDAENRMAARLAKLPIRWIAGLGVAALMIFLIAPVARRGSVPGAAGLDEWVKNIFDHPVVSTVCAPLVPWARMSAAHNLTEFLPWFALCFVIWFALFELTARIPIDFRELSLETSADVAKRIHRARRGALGASGTQASSSSAGWRVPWWFGRGPFGAIAWRKSATILRKARGTFITSALIVAVLTAVSTLLFTGKGDDAPIFGSLLISLVGTLYLCAGLRFDFREDLDRMDVIKSYPLAPWRVFPRNAVARDLARDRAVVRRARDPRRGDEGVPPVDRGDDGVAAGRGPGVGRDRQRGVPVLAGALRARAGGAVESRGPIDGRDAPAHADAAGRSDRRRTGRRRDHARAELARVRQLGGDGHRSRARRGGADRRGRPARDARRQAARSLRRRARSRVIQIRRRARPTPRGSAAPGAPASRR